MNMQIERYTSLESTNTLCKERGAQGASEGTVIIAEHQTAGKGQRGRHFWSPAGTGLYMSVLLRPACGGEIALRITTAAAVAVCRAIERCSSQTAAIKWVNDVYLNDKKVCGILCEAALKGSSLDYVALGIGVNVNTPKGGFPDDIGKIAAAVFESGGDLDVLAQAILKEFVALYDTLDDGAYIDEYRRRCLLVGREVSVCSGEHEQTATVLDVDEQCRLVVRYDDGREERLCAGDVSIRI